MWYNVYILKTEDFLCDLKNCGNNEVLEKGNRMPDSNILGKLADYFNVSVDYLLGREADSERDEKPQLHIPDKYKDVLVAFEGGADDLTQEDVDKVIEYIELLRTKNRSKK